MSEKNDRSGGAPASDGFERVLTKPANGVTLKGDWKAVVRGPDGRVKDSIAGTNLITTNGLEYLASFLHSAATSASNTMQYVAVGTDSTTETSNDTGLGTEIGRHTGTITYTSGGIYSVIATFAAGSATGAVVEYGLFSSNSGGTMLNRTTQSVINVGASDELEVTANITFA